MHISLLLVTIVIIILTGLFVATEFATVRVRSTQLETLLLTDKRASFALEIHKDLKRHLSGIQVAITLLTISLGAVGEKFFINCFQNWLYFIPSQQLSILISTSFGLVVITLLQVVLSELLPRSIAIRSALSIALMTAKPLLYWSKFIFPITYVLISLTHFIEYLIGLKKHQNEVYETSPSEEEIKQILIKSKKSNENNFKHNDLIENIFEFSKHTTKEIAIPRSQIDFLDLRRTLGENLSLAKASSHTRLPVVDGNLDHVVGVIHLKELLWTLHEKNNDIHLRDLIQPIFFVPEMRPIHNLLLDFQQRKQHLAIVVNEHGGVDGLVTLEDVLEELVGEIQDEFDREIKQIKRAKGGIWIAHGTITLEQLENSIGIHLEATSDSLTLGGFFQEQLGRILKVGDELYISGWHLRVLRMSGMAPKKFLLKPIIKKNN